jgi:hypothetical protein
MDDVRYEHREGGGMRLTLIKHLTEREADAAGEACVSEPRKKK